jgi:cell wall-associated NlpC family hydrolase
MTEAQLRQDFVALCKSKLGAPYIWGSNGPDSFDCSGLVVFALRKLQLIPQASDYSAKMLCMASPARTKDVKPGDLAFYGPDIGRISHVSIALDGTHFLSASGGDSTTTTAEAAKKAHACVKLHSRAAYRPDFIGVFINPFLVVKNG